MPSSHRVQGGPFSKCEAVTPNDTTNLPSTCQLYIGTSGDVAVETDDGTTGIFKNHPVGYMPGNIVKVLQTGTTASDIIAVW